MRRGLRFLSLCFILGLLTTTATAWLFATVPFRSTVGSTYGVREASSSSERLVIHRYDRRGTTEIYMIGGGTALMPGDVDAPVRPVEELVPPSLRPTLAPWGWNDRSPSGSNFYLVRRIHIHGWPFPALWSAFEAVPNPNGYWGHKTISGWTPIKTWSGFRSLFPPGDPPVSFPYRPYWPGLAADTALHAVVWALLLPIIPAIRGLLRRRRGLCPRCAYSLKGLPPGSPCPECGALNPRPATRR